MRLGPYAVTPEGIASVGLNVLDSWRVRWLGIPRAGSEDPAEMCRLTFRRNARGVLWAGTGHFRFMWVSDFGKALRGALKALDHAYLRGQILHMLKQSDREGRVTSCFTPSRGFDMPYYRGDNLPWLFHSVAEYARAASDRALVEEARPVLQRLLEEYERTHLVDGLVDPRITGDWMDTILRPSSTYNNLCVLHMLRLAPELGVAPKTDAGAFAERLLEDRWKGEQFVDYAGARTIGVDAGVLALYLELFDAPLRAKIAEGLERRGFAEPVPMRVSDGDYDVELMPFFTRLTPRYHSSVWLHLGLMYLNGLRRAGREVSGRRQRVEAVFRRFGHVVEAVTPEGEPYSTFFHSTEYGLTMAAGQYLELIA